MGSAHWDHSTTYCPSSFFNINDSVSLCPQHFQRRPFRTISSLSPVFYFFIYVQGQGLLFYSASYHLLSHILMFNIHWLEKQEFTSVLQVHILLQALLDFLEQQGAASSLDSFPTTALDAPIVPQHRGLKEKVLSRKLNQDSRHNHCQRDVTAISLSKRDYIINNNKYNHKHSFVFIFFSTFICLLSISIYKK